MKKFLALVLALVMTMSLVTVSASAKTDFTDDDKIVNSEAVEVLSAMGVIGGYADGTYRPQATLTRGSGAKFIAYLVLGQEAADNLGATYTVFKDVDSTVGQAKYIEWAYARGIVSGYGDGNFGPYDTLTEYAFGKMLLAALGYDAAKEGFTGAGWQKNVYALAITTGIYDGTEAAAACTRDNAARMALGAVKARIVVYGDTAVNGKYYWNGTVIATGNVTVTGAVETRYTLGGLYGVVYSENARDMFGRPGHAWTYDDADFDKFYMEETVAEYTASVSDCDVLVALGIAKTSSKSVDVHWYIDGAVQTDSGNAMQHTTSNACTTVGFGGQGVLTQVFDMGKDTNGDRQIIVTEINTYLAEVESAKDATHRLPGKSVVEIYNARLADNYSTPTAANVTTGAVVADNIGYEADDLILVNYGAYDKDVSDTFTMVDEEGDPIPVVIKALEGQYDFDTTDGDHDLSGINGLVIAGQPTVIENAKFDGVDYTNLTKAHVAGNWEKVAYGYAMNDSGLSKANAEKEKKYDFLVDQYGNLIGDASAADAYGYGVLVALKWSNDGGIGNEKALANIYASDATLHSDVTVTYYGENKFVGTSNTATGVPGSYTVAQNEANNVAYYNTDGVFYGVVKNFDDDKLVPVTAYADGEGAVIVKDCSVTKGSANVKDSSGDVVNTVHFNNNTKFLVKTKDGSKDVYTSYVGKDALKSIESIVALVAVYDDNGSFAEFVYIDATNSVFSDSTVIAAVVETDTGYYLKGSEYSYDVYINGQKTQLEAISNVLNSNDASDLFTNGSGLYELYFNDNGKLYSADLLDDTDGWLTKVVATDGVEDGAVSFDYDATSYSVASTTTVYLVKYIAAAGKTLDWSNKFTASEITINDITVGSAADLAEDQVVCFKVDSKTKDLIDTIFVWVADEG